MSIVKSSLRNFNEIKVPYNSRFTQEIQSTIPIDTINISLQLNHITKMIEDSLMKFTKRYLVLTTELEEMKREFVCQTSLVTEYITLTKKEIRFDKFDKYQQGKPMLSVSACPNYEQKCLTKTSKNSISKPNSRNQKAKQNLENKKTTSKLTKKNVSREKNKTLLTSPYTKSINKGIMKPILKEENNDRNNSECEFKTVSNRKTPQSFSKRKEKTIESTIQMNSKEKDEYHKKIFQSIKNKKAKACYCMIYMNNIIPLSDKIKLCYLNKDIFDNIDIKDMLNENLIEIQSKIDKLEKKNNENISEENKSIIEKLSEYPSKTARKGLSFLTQEREEELMDDDNPVNKELINMIYCCLGKDNGEDFNNVREAYGNLFKEYNVSSVKELFIDVVYNYTYRDIFKNIKQDWFKDYKEKVIQTIQGNQELVTDSLAKSQNKTFSYVAFSLDEISDFFLNIDKIDSNSLEQLKIQREILQLQQQSEIIESKIT